MNIINEGRKCGRTAIPGNKTDKRDAYFHPFLSLFMNFHRAVDISPAASAILPLVRYRSFPAPQTPPVGKGQPSFSRQRMSLPPPHARQSVRANLHNSGGKCQRAESMMIRCF